MANEDVKFSRGVSSSVPVEKVPGRFLFETDTGIFYLDVSSEERVPVIDPRLTERFEEEFSGTRLASSDGVGPGVGAYFKVVNMVNQTIEDLPDFSDESAQPQYALLMTSKVRQGFADSMYVQTLFCNTGSVYSRPVEYYSGNYSNEPWVKVGPGAGGASPSAKISTLNPKSGNELSLSSLTDAQLFDSLTSSEEGTIEYWEFSETPSSISDVPSGVVGIGACDGFTLINALIKRDSSSMRAYYYQQFIAYNGKTFYRSVEQRQDIVAPTSEWTSAGSPPDATTLTKGIVRLNSQVNLDSEQYAATPKAVKSAYDQATEAYDAATDANQTASDALASAESKLPAPVEMLDVDVNTLTTAGMYYVNGGGSTNTPSGSSGFLIVNELPGAGTPSTLQIFGVSSTNKLYFRHQFNGSWKKWYEVVSSGTGLIGLQGQLSSAPSGSGVNYGRYLNIGSGAGSGDNYGLVIGSRGELKSAISINSSSSITYLDALVKGVNVRYGTSNPSGGSDGDIYIKI